MYQFTFNTAKNLTREYILYCHKYVHKLKWTAAPKIVTRIFVGYMCVFMG